MWMLNEQYLGDAAYEQQGVVSSQQLGPTDKTFMLAA